jgi:hypothetical protein
MENAYLVIVELEDHSKPEGAAELVYPLLIEADDIQAVSKEEIIAKVQECYGEDITKLGQEIEVHITYGMNKQPMTMADVVSRCSSNEDSSALPVQKKVEFIADMPEIEGTAMSFESFKYKMNK